MTTITIPREITKIKGKELFAIPRKEYEEFLSWQKKAQPPKKFKTIKSTAAEIREFKLAQKDYQKGRFITLNELKRQHCH